MVRVSVTDDGPGIAPEARLHLFVPFFTTREPDEGSGLGLAVSFGIVAAHGGRLWYEPGPDGVRRDVRARMPAAPGSTTGRPSRP